MVHLETRGIPPSVSRQLKQEVMEGSSLSDALARQAVIFTPMYVNMVRAGEQSGALQEVLRRLAEHYTRFAEVQQKFRSAMIYPAFVAVVGVVIIIVFMTVLLPKFMTMFNGMDIEPPLTTQILIGTSRLMSKYWWLFIAVLLAVILVFKRYQSTVEGRRRIDGLKLRVPVFGKVAQLNLFGQFARTLCTLLENGVPVLTALKISEQIMPNVILRDAISKTREEVTDGKTLAQPLARSKVFPQLMIDLIRIGEETGDVPAALQNVADTYENELAIALRVMMNMIEPVMIVVMSVGVGFLLLSVLSMMFKMISNIQVTGGGR
jgi:type II secretory pathway component PulF